MSFPKRSKGQWPCSVLITGLIRRNKHQLLPLYQVAPKYPVPSGLALPH